MPGGGLLGHDQWHGERERSGDLGHLHRDRHVQRPLSGGLISLAKQ